MKKRILSLMLVVVMTIMLFPNITASAMTPQEGADWALAQVGKSIDFDGVYGAQCVDLIKKYCNTHWGWTPKGNAKEDASIALPNSSWTRIKNTPEFIPQPGDIAVWTNGTYGHVAIIISANINSFVSVDQNWYNANGTVGSPAAKVTHNYSGFWGVIRPPFSSATVETSQPIHSATSATVRNGYFTFKNVSSGTFMNVWGGSDANKTAITTYSFDGSVDQRFNVVHQGSGKYKLYAECSSSGTNRVVDVFRNGAAPAAGQLVDLWTPDDDTAQLFYIVPLDDGSYVFELASKDGYVIAPTNASAAASNTTSSQLTLQKYTGASHQKWKICNNNGKETTATGSYTVGSYLIDTDGDSVNMRNGAGASYTRVGSIPDKTTVNVTSVSGNWGYTTYNGVGGWFCLDYTVFNPTVTSISIASEPRTKTYFVGEDLDTTNLSINVSYSNNYTKEVTSGFTTSYDFSTTGTKTVTVTYSGKATSFTVEVVNPTIEDLEITSPATKTSYSVGDTIDTKGLTLKAIYNDGSEKTVTSGFTTDYDFSTSGPKTVTIEYEGLTVSYNVTVEAVGTAVISLTSPTGAKKGDLIDVVVKLSNSQNMYDGNFVITYDNEILQLKSNSIGSSLANQNPTLNTAHAQNKIKLSYAGTNAVSNGNMLSLAFEVISDSKTSTNIEISEVNMYNISGNKVNVTKSNSPCSINISKTQENADAIFTLSDVSGKPGDTVKVKLSLKSSQSINTIAISDISFSDALTFEGFSDYEEISNLAAITPTFDETNKAIVVGLKNATAFDCDICTLDFKIDEDAEEGELFVSANSVVKLNSTNISSTVKSSTVTVRTHVLGDVNGDENVDLQDAIALLNHSMLPEIYPIPYVGSVDFNKDGSIDLQDAILLLNYSMLPDIYPIG